MTIYPLSIAEEYPFSDEKSVTVIGEESIILSAADKWQLLQSWQRFLLSGFKNLFFRADLYRFVIHYCHLNAERNREQFWQFHCSSDISRLKAILQQFGGDRRSVEQGNHLWLDGLAADLKEAMCREASRLYAPLSQVLQDLEIKHKEMIAAWHDFAIAANITAAVLPPAYQVSENTRNLLAYAATIALKHQRPLTGLQMMFPLPQQPLLPPVPVEGGEVIMINDEELGLSLSKE